MRLGIVRRARGLHDYVAEMLRTWGIASLRMLDAPELGSASPRDVPVVVLPAGDANPADDEAFLEYARRGGTGLCFLPGPSLAAGLGLDTMGEKAWPLRFRATGCVVPGLAGESIPIAARAQTWGETDSDVLGFLCHPGQYSGETPGVVAVPSGRGRIVAFAFDLAECVQILRQGDPSRAERVPPEDGCARPSHIAAELGQHDAGWVPFADLLACFLADLARASCPFPLPRFSHLPGQAASILLYSGDEDHASPAATAEEMHAVQAAGGSMSLYLIPTATESTPDDVQRYRQHHAVGPHPNLRPLDGHPVAERLAEPITVDLVNGYAPVEMDSGHRLIGRLLDATEKAAGIRRTLGWSGATDASSFADRQIVTPILGPGGVAQAHTQDEYIEVQQLEKGLEVYGRFLGGDDWGI